MDKSMEGFGGVLDTQPAELMVVTDNDVEL